MSDDFRRFTGRQTGMLTRTIRGVYAQAQQEITEKMERWQKHHAEKDALMRADLKAGKITDEEYRQWMRGQVFVGKQWADQQKEIAGILVNADREASRLINDGTRAVFVESANHAAYELEKDLGGVVNFSLYDGQTVASLVGRNPELMPRRMINGQRAEAWQTRQVSNAIAQGIIQGESIPEIAKRIANDTGMAAEKATTRYARTAMTGAQNAGRQARMEEAEEELESEGIEIRKRWDATLDDRTREAHQKLDGVTIPVDEDFQNEIGKIAFPGDPSADDANVWNCRCTLSYVYPGIPVNRQRRAYRWVEGDDGKMHRESYIVGDVTYQEWLEGKTEPETAQADESRGVQGHDITETWERRPGEFDLPIKDVVNAQGFDGDPILVDEDEFERIAQESGYAAQRAYTAPDQETLDLYREALYGGDWYLDCSGGSAMGHGMYVSVTTPGGEAEQVLTESVKQYAAGSPHAYIEHMTVLPGANVAPYMEIEREYTGFLIGRYEPEIRKIVLERGHPEGTVKEVMDIFRAGRTSEEYRARRAEFGDGLVMRRVARLIGSGDDKFGGDIGTYAAAKGFDAIIDDGFANYDGPYRYMVILNRTKCVIRRP